VAGGGDLGRRAKQLLQIVRRGMGRNISAEDRAAWEEANLQYRNYKRLTERDFVVNAETGDVNPKAVARVLNAEGDLQQRGMVQGPMGDIASFGRGMPSHAVGSQTAPRLLWQQLRDHPVQAISGIPGEYLPAAIMARGGLVKLHPQAQAVISPLLGYLGRAAAPGGLLGLLGD